MNIAIIGTGYVGLVTAACLADFGNRVYGIDKDELKLAGLQTGETPFFEPGLDELVGRNIAKGRITFHINLKEAGDDLDLIFICVGTYPLEDGSPDLSQVMQAAREIADSLKPDRYAVIIQKSTAPPGTAKQVEDVLHQNLPAEAFDVASNPEFLREGTAIQDTLYPDRIVIGATSDRAFGTLEQLYEPIIRESACSVLRLKPVEAEMVKYAANAFLATKISYANSIALLCDKVGADINNVVEGFGSDKRIGKAFLRAGIGYGGSCFPKDVKGLISVSEKWDFDFKLLRYVEALNFYMRDYFLEKVVRELGPLQGQDLCVYGLSFKPNTDDLRESPALAIVNKLVEMGARVKAHDPIVKEIPSDITMAVDPYEAAEGSAAILLLTEWSDYEDLDYERLRGLMKKPVIFDGRNLLNGSKLGDLGFKYFGIGTGGQ